MITAILVPLDGSAIAEEAVPYAQALLPDGGDLVTLRVVPEPEPPLTSMARLIPHWPPPALTSSARELASRIRACAGRSRRCVAIPPRRS
jgi:nucleotide-binding universal stress UspA family protein